MGWVIYTNPLSSMLATENNRENHLILNQLYDMLTELNKQKNKLFYAKSMHTGIKRKEEADKAGKKTKYICQGITTTRLPHTDY